MQDISGTTRPTETVHLSKCAELKMWNNGDTVGVVSQRLFHENFERKKQTLFTPRAQLELYQAK